MNKILICLLSLVALSTGQRITTIHLDGVQYFISRMNPYSPELNYFLAYQYCRSLGLQLASFETKEKAESMTMYLKNAGYGNYDFWTSGNRLGTGMFLWMSTGLPFNATFDFFENSADAVQAGLLDPVDHNSNTAPQRTARDSSSGAEKGCVILKQPTLKWMPEDCSAVKDFICEQTRCYYYNYGSIPVSSAQGRPITTTTPRSADDVLRQTEFRTTTVFSTTTTTSPLPLLISSFGNVNKKLNQPSYVSLKLDQERALNSIGMTSDSQNIEENDENEHEIADDGEEQQERHNSEINQIDEMQAHDDVDDHEEDSIEQDDAVNTQENVEVAYNDRDLEDLSEREEEDEELPLSNNAKTPKAKPISSSSLEDASSEANVHNTISHESYEATNTDEMPSVEVRLKQISQEVEKQAHNENRHIPSLSSDLEDVGHQSFLSLTDLIRTLRPNDKQIIPQIDSDYSNAMRVLGEKSIAVSNDHQQHQQQQQKQHQ
ncbi:narrow isoform 1-T1 [Glossina fuscipes fuscipes]